MPELFDALGRRLTQDEPLLPPDQRQAAVAVVLREVAGHVEVLLMQRAERPHDRWSGQISLPGGHREPGDPSLAATAARETREEVGIDLAGSVPLGHLAPVQARAQGKGLPLTIAPVVFPWPERARIELGPEATYAFWFPLTRAGQGELDEMFEYPHGDEVLRLPSWRYDERVVWGLTHHILRTFIDLLPRAARPGDAPGQDHPRT